MAIEIRNPAEAELRAAMAVGAASFGDEPPNDDDFERERRTMPLDRFLGAYDGETPVGTAGAYPFELTVPGGHVKAAGVTWVGVLPSHRRRGILRDFMRRLFDDARERDEPVAILWASESAIYGRFGYGIAAPSVGLDAAKDGFAYRDDPGAAGAVRLVDKDEALARFPAVYERVRRDVPGVLSRTHDWWEHGTLGDPERWRRGASPKFYAALELDGELAGYALYRVKSEWERGLPRGTVRVVELFGATPRATRELWRFLFSIDLVTRVESHIVDPGSPLFLMVVDARRLGLGLSDGLWLRFLDVERALRARSYGSDDPVVVQLRDELCPWNAGRWRIAAGDVGRVDDEPELDLDVADLASAYLGAFDFHALAAAERARELKPGALERATRLFRTDRPPYCPEVF